MKIKRGVAAWLLAAAALCSAAANADILVLLDGSRIETLGPWVSDGTHVAYFPPKGDARILRANEVDLEATKLVNLIASRTVKAEPAKPRPVIDDSMVAHVAPEVIRQRVEAERSAKEAADNRANLSVGERGRRRAGPPKIAGA
jgi:hypothetical protein